MKRLAHLGALAALATGLTVCIGTAPASAGVTATTSGTVLTVALTGASYADFGCSGGKVAVNGAVATPPLNCTALTQATVTGDSGNQTVYGDQLRSSTFAAGPRLVATMGDGADYVIETPKADQLDLGPSDDTVTLYVGGLANTSIAMGTGFGDSMNVTGQDVADTMTATSTSGTVNVATTNFWGSYTSTASGVEWLTVSGGAGGDTISGTGITAASALTSTVFLGEAGNDTIRTGVLGANIDGGSGTNTLIGNSGQDSIHSGSETDSVDVGAGASTDYVYDEASLHTGGRTLLNVGANDVYSVLNPYGDSTYRLRAGPGAGQALGTTSLTRNGQQILPSGVPFVVYSAGTVGAPAHRVILDVVAGAKQFNGGALPTDTVLLDVTVPSGAWTVGTGVGYVVIDPTNASYANVSANQADAYKVHGPWTDRRKGFVHRVTRDLMFRFATDANRDAVAADLAAGSITRSGLIAVLMNNDEYRGLDVDRVFLKFLRRTSDASGRTYWINRLREGRSLTRFRAQLFGSSEYFTKAGDTNASYVAKAYADVLGRAPDASGLAFWTGRLDGGANRRGAVALEFLSSTEARRSIVTDQFLRFIDRVPTSAESTTWVSNLADPAGEQQLIAFLANSTAYNNRD